MFLNKYKFVRLELSFIPEQGKRLKLLNPFVSQIGHWHLEITQILERPGVNVIKLCSFIADDEAKQARVFVPGNHFQV
jgi:hypothetical protein